jgi:quercetin dioxygenase-like cupin family protein
MQSRAGDRGRRRIFATGSLSMRPYDLEGPLQEDVSYAFLSYDEKTRCGSYLIRMQPGAATIFHTHEHREEFLVLEGLAIDDDGTVLNAGDWIVYEPGTRHSTRTETGCVLLGIDWDPPRDRARR